ncbi:MAG: T9SS type A sorting domain-containing protein, partial [Bacteroidota bacterium]
PVQLNDGSYRYCRLNDNFQIEIYDESFSTLNLVSLPNLGVDVTARIEQLGTSIFDTDDGLEFAVSSFDAAYPGLMYWLIDEDGSVIFNHEGNLIVVNPEDADPSFFTVSTNFQNESTFTIYRGQNQEIINSVELPFGDIFFAYNLPVVGPTYFISQRDPERIEAFDQAFNSLFVQENTFQLEEDENLFINGATYDRFGSGGVEFLAEILGPDNVQETFLLSENGQVLFSTGFAEFLQINELPGLQPKLVGNIFPLTVNVYGGDFDLSTKSLQTPTYSLTLLPNPAHAELNWRADLSVEKYEIWDANGVLQSYGPVNGNTLSIEDLSSGFYIIRLRGEQTWQGSFVKN